MKKTRHHIEFFAGCGGMAIGMENAGFSLKLANEVSPMASETFAFNILGEDMSDEPKLVNWLSSDFTLDNYKNRLRENLLEEKEYEYSDLNKRIDLNGKLIIGDIKTLHSFLKENPKNLDQIKNVDLVSGGPPCQSFSLAGKREKNNDKNKLPLVFAKTCGLIKPKVVLLENVKGILAPFQVEGGKYYAWIEVSKAFALQGYVPICMLLNSKYFRIPQNRPRFIMLAFRLDIFTKMEKIISSKILENSKSFYIKVNDKALNLNKIGIKDIAYYDIEKVKDILLFDGKILPLPITLNPESWYNVEDAISDLKKTKDNTSLSKVQSDYSNYLDSIIKQYKGIVVDSLKNHEQRNHSTKVVSRFRFYQLLNNFNGSKNIALSYLYADLDKREISKELLDKFEFVKNEFVLMTNGQKKKLKNKKDWSNYLKDMHGTKKHTQKALVRSAPAPAQLTIPDDMCHYDKDAPRALTVREMARIQSFPDWFEFRSKVTTGGKNRKYEVPQYTQVGNAVPPVLAYHLGQHIKNILDSINE